jgi:hypothetical protein
MVRKNLLNEHFILIVIIIYPFSTFLHRWCLLFLHANDFLKCRMTRGKPG